MFQPNVDPAMSTQTIGAMDPAQPTYSLQSNGYASHGWANGLNIEANLTQLFADVGEGEVVGPAHRESLTN